MDIPEAQRVVESLRKGIPPEGYVRQFTVGRESEVTDLCSFVDLAEPHAVMLQANYGSGKTHLLRFVREYALAANFAVSSVNLDAKGALRFNRMDQVVASVCRNLEVPGACGSRGVRAFFAHVLAACDRAKLGDGQRLSFWRALTNDWRWDFSSQLESAALFVALRAWACADAGVCDLVEDWLYNPEAYKAQRQRLYDNLVVRLRAYFRDPRPVSEFCRHGLSDFRANSYKQSWSLLHDLNTLARQSDLRGLVLLLDEFEDVLSNMGNIVWQESALWNLRQFHRGREFPGVAFFAVTPEFVVKAKQMLWLKGRSDYDYKWFEELDRFAMSPLRASDLEELALKIMTAHGEAFGWEPDLVVKHAQLRDIVRRASSVQVQDRARHTIKTVVTALDALLETSDE